MITIGYGQVSGSLNNDDLVYWLFGFHQSFPDTLKLGEIEITSPIVQGGGELYAISLNNQDAELPAPWVLPWASGLAAGHGVDLHGMLDHDSSERVRRMQALMLCHRSGWLAYYGVRTAG